MAAGKSRIRPRHQRVTTHRPASLSLFPKTPPRPASCFAYASASAPCATPGLHVVGRVQVHVVFSRLQVGPGEAARSARPPGAKAEAGKSNSHSVGIGLRPSLVAGNFLYRCLTVTGPNESTLPLSLSPPSLAAQTAPREPLSCGRFAHHRGTETQSSFS